jgi:hypothetical protein
MQYFISFMLIRSCFPFYVISAKSPNLQVQAEKLVIEKNSVANGIVELIDQHHITKLVMGTSSFSVYAKMPLFHCTEASS